MATTVFFDKLVKDKGSKSEIDIELGRSSYYGGENLFYLELDGKTVIMNEEDGREFCEAVDQVARYLGYNKA